nr:MAG TPA: hypothetical protein [Caudoviricetes sp.]
MQQRHPYVLHCPPGFLASQQGQNHPQLLEHPLIYSLMPVQQRILHTYGVLFLLDFQAVR